MTVVVIQVLEQLVARQSATGFHEPGETAIVEIDFVFDAALSPERERHPSTIDRHVSISQRGQAEGTIGPRVLVVADADEGLLEQLHDQRYHLRLREAGSPEVGVRPPPDRRQRVCERDHAVVLGLVAYLAPARVIAILLPAARVPASGLEMPARVRANPHITPCRRNHQRLDALQIRSISEDTAVGCEVGEAASRSATLDARLAV